jgi:hypothetical protein
MYHFDLFLYEHGLHIATVIALGGFSMLFIMSLLNGTGIGKTIGNGCCGIITFMGMSQIIATTAIVAVISIVVTLALNDILGG